jgi:hypothetical protein
LRLFVASVLGARLALAPLAFADRPEPDTSSIREAAAREAARLAHTSARGPMPAGLKWTGIGLLAGATMPVFVARFGDCVPSDFSCRDQRHAAYVVAGLMAGTGALLLVIANAKRSPAWPSVSVQAGRASITQRVTF